MRKLIRSVALSFALMLGLAATASAEELNLDFTLVNKTGWAIKEVYVAPTTSTDWEEDLLKEPLKDGESLEISFESEHKSKKWDLRIVWVDEGAPVIWKGYDLTEISKLTLFYDPKTDVTSAKAE